MKKLVLVCAMIFAGFMMTRAQSVALSSAPGGVPAFRWLTDSTIMVGKVTQNKPVTVTFEFVNNGKAPLIISRVEPSCGCTAVDYSKEPVAPNQKGFIKALYNAASVGTFTKTVTVFSNAAEMRKVLTLQGEVVSK